ncbi:MAG: lactonase family protein [Anaerolineales bacterium]|nr:lactonase family protein [Anaerolineales bacterium]
MYLFVGTYTMEFPHVAGKSDGIQVYWFDSDNGELRFASKFLDVDNPSYLTLHPNGRFLYAATEATSDGGEGLVTAFAIDGNQLTWLNSQPATGANPCYVSTNGRFLFTANYGGGSVAVYPLDENGRLHPASHHAQHHGHGTNPARQEAPHAHCVLPTPDGRFLLAVDLGIDQVVAYRLSKNEQLEQVSTIGTSPGSGPRHLVFHSNGRFAYLLHELTPTLAVYAYEPDGAILRLLQTVPTIPADYDGENYGADVHLEPNGRFLYASNRGHDSLATFACDPATGLLTPLGHTATQGSFPRGFVIAPNGRFLLAANQNNDNIIVFRLDASSGQLTPIHQTVCATPVCLKFQP